MKKVVGKGFTLIELLAVIVILGIIALITTPLILGVVEDAKESAVVSSAYGYIDAVENVNIKALFEETNILLDGVYDVSEVMDIIDMHGEVPSAGTFKIDKKDQVISAILCIRGYKVSYNNDDVIIMENNCDDMTYIDNTLNVEENFYKDASGASVPELSDGMIPIKWDGLNWIKADVTKAWYDYDLQEWANVVLVNEATRTTYISAIEGTIINEEDIMAYLVWIPRFRYKLFNVVPAYFDWKLTAEKIDIIFENKIEEKSKGTINDMYLTHPAFTFGVDELNGFWVGKFETAGTATIPTIKPNIVSLVDQNVITKFTTAQKFNTTLTYGLTIANDSHIMKNMEWGAVAYLSQSDYGKYGNSIYNNNIGLEKEVYINNIMTGTLGLYPSITGCAANSVSATKFNSTTCPDSNQYLTAQGVKASTTGNIYGIYDMSGGTSELVMGAEYNNDNLTIDISDSGFSQAMIDSEEMSKYLDKYSYGSDTGDFRRGKLGDATTEVRNWNSDGYDFIIENNSWFSRGGYASSTDDAGIFYYRWYDGRASDYMTFRLVVLGD